MHIVTNGKVRPSEVVQAVDGLMKRMKQNGLWETLDFMVQVWMKKNPEYARQFIKEQKTLKETRRKHAAFQNKSNQLLVSLPAEIHHFVNVFWGDEIQAMGTKEFYRRVAKKYPIFKIPEGNI